MSYNDDTYEDVNLPENSDNDNAITVDDEDYSSEDAEDTEEDEDSDADDDATVLPEEDEE